MIGINIHIIYRRETRSDNPNFSRLPSHFAISESRSFFDRIFWKKKYTKIVIYSRYKHSNPLLFFSFLTVDVTLNSIMNRFSTRPGIRTIFGSIDTWFCPNRSALCSLPSSQLFGFLKLKLLEPFILFFFMCVWAAGQISTDRSIGSWRRMARIRHPSKSRMGALHASR
jgi:hypothetical protein